MTYPWGDNRRFNSYSNYFTKQFGGRVQKISIDAGFSCPNRDGKISTGGCTFCSNEAFNPSYCQPEKSIKQQIEEGIEFHRRRYRRASQYLAYFQPFSNTYKPLEELKGIYRQALEVPEIRYVGWDFAITKNGPVIMEGNEYPSYGLVQYYLFNDEHEGHLKQISDILGDEMRKIKL